MDDPLLDKIQNLMGKYQHQQPAITPSVTQMRGPTMYGDTKPEFPVLTDIVKLGDAVFHANLPEIPVRPLPPLPLQNEDADQIAQRIFQIIDTQLQSQVETLIVPRLQRAMDEAMAALLPQLMTDLETVIRESLHTELLHYGISLKDGEESV